MYRCSSVCLGRTTHKSNELEWIQMDWNKIYILQSKSTKIEPIKICAPFFLWLLLEWKREHKRNLDWFDYLHLLGTIILLLQYLLRKIWRIFNIFILIWIRKNGFSSSVERNLFRRKFSFFFFKLRLLYRITFRKIRTEFLFSNGTSRFGYNSSAASLGFIFSLSLSLST